MLTWCSDSTWATSRSSRDRSSALTSTDDHERGRLVVVPLDLDEPLGLVSTSDGGVGAVGAVHRHAAAAGDEAHDLVAGHRRAAPRQPHHHVVEPLDVHAGGAALGPAGALAAAGRW